MRAWWMMTALLAGAVACGSPDGGVGGARHTAAEWDPFLDTLQERTLRYFLETTDPRSGLARDRYPSSSPSSVAAVGFALTCYPIAADRGLISRDEATRRTLATLRKLWSLPQHPAGGNTGGYRGFFYHFVDLQSGLRVWESELSTVDTGLLMAGVLFAQSYFHRDDALEDSLRALADTLYRRIDWKWSMGESDGILLGWTPEDGFHHLTWHGYNEAMIVYLLALGSPTHPVPPSAWKHWTHSYLWARYMDQEFLGFGPLFGHQYSHCWVDFRGIQDSYMKERGIDYAENTRRATYAQRRYATLNQGGYSGYADSLWGFTACDGPAYVTLEIGGRERKFEGYAARGVSVDWVNDDGTIAPTAAGGSIAFAPEICLPALKAMRHLGGGRLWTDYGFRDAFNLSYVTPETPAGWVGNDFLGIDQGPIAIMIENLRSGLVWKTMRSNRYVVEGLRKAGFSGGWLEQ